METLTAFLTLLFVMDPLGNIPIFMSALKEVPEERRQRVILRELMIALGVLVFFLLAGNQLLQVLGLSSQAIQIAGAIVLYLIALKMIFPTPGGIMGEQDQGGEPFIVPLAIPCVAGPSTLAILMLLSSSEEGRLNDWLIAVMGAWGVCCIILLSAAPLSRLLGPKGMIAVERLMGMLLIMIAVQMTLDGMQTIWPVEN